MTLNDLKTGMIVTMRNGTQYTTIRNMATSWHEEEELFIYTNFDQSKCVGFNDHGNGWMPFDRYNNDLKHRYDPEWDIVKVETSYHPHGFMYLGYEPHRRTVIWVEPTATKLTVSEIEKLLGYKVEIISEEE